MEAFKFWYGDVMLSNRKSVLGEKKLHSQMFLDIKLFIKRVRSQKPSDNKYITFDLVNNITIVLFFDCFTSNKITLCISIQ